MKQFQRVLAFSFRATIKAKGMLVSTIILCVLIAGGLSVPTVINLFDKDADVPPLPDGTPTPGETPGGSGQPDEGESEIIVVDPNGHLFTTTESLAVTFPDYKWTLDNNGDEQGLTRRVEASEVYAALIVVDNMTARYISNTDINVFGSDLSNRLQGFLTDNHRYGLLMDYQVSDEDAERFFNVPMLQVVNVGMKNMIGQVQSMVFIMFLYIAILSSGQMVATSVTQEKSSRAMEVLITTSRPETLMFGKVIGIGLAGLCQMLIFLATAVTFYFLNQNALVSMEIVAELFKIPLTTFLYAFLFFLGGYFFYAMLFAAIGSLVSRTEDLASANTPMTLLSVGGFLVAIYGQLYGFADSMLYKVLSYIPFTSPYVMLARLCSESNIRWWSVLISLILLYISTAFMGVLSAKIYRVGVLIYGKRPTMKEVFAALKQA